MPKQQTIKQIKELQTKETIFFEIKEFYYTSDLCLAVILKMNNYPIAQWRNLGDGSGNRKLVFFFKKDEEMKKLIDDYFNLPMERHPFKKFYAELREIKNLIYNS